MHLEARQVEIWPDKSTYSRSTSEIPLDADRVLLYRDKNSHRGISKFDNVKKLKAKNLNQDFLEEVAQMEQLEYLEIDVVTATNLEPLTRLAKLETLRIESIRKPHDFAVLLGLEKLRKLFLCHSKYLLDIKFLSYADKLTAIGIEGSMWTTQKIPTLAPLQGLASLEALFLTSTTLTDKNLSYLSTCPNLKILECARFSTELEFQKLRGLMPDLDCRWCDNYDVS